MKLYYHKTDGGAEYLTDTFKKWEYNGKSGKEGIFNDKTKYIIRIDGDITKDAELNIKEIKEKEFLVIGSDNFWYESGAKELKEAIAEIKDIKKSDNIQSYANPESGQTQNVLPDEFYIFEARQVKTIKGE